MNEMKRIFALLVIFASVISVTCAKDFADETVNYKVMFKWGLINKQAGTVSIQLKNAGKHYQSELTAASAPWADRFYKVRDTLRCEIIRDGLKPTIYQKFAHEDKDYNRDQVTYRREGDTVYGDCMHRSIRNGNLRREVDTTLVATGMTLDMLTSFYYMRQLPYASWKPGQTTSVNIYSGRKKELLTIKYNGMETIETDGKLYDCYHITFIFTSGGKKKSSDDMSAWIDKNTSIPIKLEGKLPVGSVRCFYTGGINTAGANK